MKLEPQIVDRNQFSPKLQVRRDLRKGRQHFLSLSSRYCFITLISGIFISLRFHNLVKQYQEILQFYTS